MDSRSLAIVSNNCVAGILYEIADLPKRTPTAGLFLSGRAFPSFLADLGSGQTKDWELEPGDLRHIPSRGCWELPVENGSIVFLHYAKASEATEKWNRRLLRMEGRELIVVASMRDGLSKPMLDEIADTFPLMFVAPQVPAPPADELMNNRKFLLSLSEFFDEILQGGRNSGPRNRASEDHSR